MTVFFMQQVIIVIEFIKLCLILEKQVFKVAPTREALAGMRLLFQVLKCITQETLLLMLLTTELLWQIITKIQFKSLI